MAELTIKVGGQEISDEMSGCVLEVVVDTCLHLPDMCTILLIDTALRWVDDGSLDVGKEVVVTVNKTLLFQGEMTALEPAFDQDGRATVLLRAYDKSHRLHLGRQTRTFVHKSDSQIVQSIAGEAGLSAQVDATSPTHEYVLQFNQTNMEFLLARAARNGYQVYGAEGTLYFKKGDWSRGQGPTLTWEENLRSFRPRLTTAHQANTVVVRGWDGKGKTAIEAQATQSSGLNQGGLDQTGGLKAQSAFGAAKEVVVDRPVVTVDEATAIATGRSNDLSRDFVQAEGICFGDPKLKAGYKVTVEGVGTRFGGSYYLTSARHVLSGGRYETAFSVSGRLPDTLHQLLGDAQGDEQAQGRVRGVVTALVTNLNDPDNLGRVKVKFPWLGSSPEIESDWMRQASPMAGAQRGLMIVPEVNDEVLVAFEHGDVHHPYIVGGLWSTTDKPPRQNSEATGEGKVNQRVLKTRAGHLIVLDDKQGEEQISVTSKGGHTVVLNDKSGSESITIRDRTGNNEMAIDSAKNSVTIKCQGDFSVTAQGKITLKSTQDMSLESIANAKVKATQLGLEATAKGELKGATVSVNGTGQTEVKSAGILQIQGSLVKIN